MAYPATTPTTSIAATTLAANNATTAGLPNSNGFDRLTYLEAIVGNLLTDAPFAYNIVTSGNLLTSSSAGRVGFTTGAGSSTTQITSKATAFTCNTITGQITFNNAALAGWTTVSAIWNNSAITANTIGLFNHISGGTVGVYSFGISSQTTSSCNIWLTNNSTASVSEAVVLKYALFNGAVS